ncbi:hypothetical protein ScPMuIL_009538 [Solemya velum]
MADINQSLKDYLSRNTSDTKSDNILNSKFSFKGLNFFSKNSEPVVEEDVSNGWYSQAQSDPIFPSLSKKQRILGFILCLLMGTFCFSMACLYIPLLLLKARKFVALYTLGSLFVIFSFSFLWGPVNHIKHLFSVGRLPFTVAYFGTLFATVYFSLWVKSTLLTVFCATVQILALVWYIVSYVPGGQTGLKFFSKLFYSVASKTAQKTLPI